MRDDNIVICESGDSYLSLSRAVTMIGISMDENTASCSCSGFGPSTDRPNRPESTGAQDSHEAHELNFIRFVRGSRGLIKQVGDAVHKLLGYCNMLAQDRCYKSQ